MASGKTQYELLLEINGKLDKSFSGAAKGAQKQLDSLSSCWKKLAGVAAAGIAAFGVGSFLGDAVDTYKDFEKSMSNTAAIADASETDYKKLEDAAREMGKATTKTAAEAADALGYMALAGWDVDDSIQALEPVLRLSEATSMDLATCSDLVTDSMSALGVTVDDLSDYLDIAAKANNKSNQSAQQLMEAYLGVGGTLTGLGVELEESATALGVMANRGIKGSEAGNALNAVLVNLTTGTGQAGEMMEKLGISAFDSQGKFIGVAETLQKVEEATSSMTDERRFGGHRRQTAYRRFKRPDGGIDHHNSGRNHRMGSPGKRAAKCQRRTGYHGGKIHRQPGGEPGAAGIGGGRPEDRACLRLCAQHQQGD